MKNLSDYFPVHPIQSGFGLKFFVYSLLGNGNVCWGWVVVFFVFGRNVREVEVAELDIEPSLEAFVDEGLISFSQKSQLVIKENHVSCAHFVAVADGDGLVVGEFFADSTKNPGKFPIFCQQVLVGEFVWWDEVDSGHRIIGR